MIIKRTVFDQLRDHLTSQEISLIVGPRQAGKTTLMKLLEEELRLRGEQTTFLSLDFDQDRPSFESQTKLIQRISFDIGKSGYVFIDEIQRKENAGIFLKGLYDMGLKYKLIVSGSGSIELKEKIHESLPGRKRLFELLTLSFEEFVNFKTEYRYQDKQGSFRQLAAFFAVHQQTAQQYLDEYLNFGGYPRVVLSETVDEKRATIIDIYQSFLEKDISILLNIQKTDSLTALLRVLAAQIGNLVNIAELSSTLGISMQTVKAYLFYLQKTYLIRKVTPYFKNVRKEITKAPTYYFIDLGLCNYSGNRFGTATASSGFLFENFVYNQLREQLRFSPTTVHFWRTQDKAEVDFVLDTTLNVIPIEVKYSHLKQPQISRSFRSFIAKYKPAKAYIVHLGSQFEETIEDTTVYFIPVFNIQAITKFSQPQ